MLDSSGREWPESSLSLPKASWYLPPTTPCQQVLGDPGGKRTGVLCPKALLLRFGVPLCWRCIGVWLDCCKRSTLDRPMQTFTFTFTFNHVDWRHSYCYNYAFCFSQVWIWDFVFLMNSFFLRGEPLAKFFKISYFGFLFPIRGITGAQRSSFPRYLHLKFWFYFWTLRNFSTYSW